MMLPQPPGFGVGTTVQLAMLPEAGLARTANPTASENQTRAKRRLFIA